MHLAWPAHLIAGPAYRSAIMCIAWLRRGRHAANGCGARAVLGYRQQQRLTKKASQAGPAPPQDGQRRQGTRWPSLLRSPPDVATTTSYSTLLRCSECYTCKYNIQLVGVKPTPHKSAGIMASMSTLHALRMKGPSN